MKFSTKLWQRSQNSYAATVPREILAIKDVPVDAEARVEWSINPETGRVEIKFTEDENSGDK